MNMTTRQKYMDAMSRRADLLRQADEAASAGNLDGLKDFTAQAAALNPEIEGYQALMDQESRFTQASPVVSREAEDLARERMEQLQNKGSVSFTVKDVLHDVFGVRNSDGDGTTLATGTLVKPTELDPNIIDAVGPLSSILEQVTVEDLTGTNGIKEPILYSDMAAQAGSIATLAGTARTASDPTFGSVAINPYEVNVTSLVDRNISRLTPVAYEAKIRSIAMRAMRRKAISLIYNGDGQVTPELYGIKTAVNTAGSSMVKAVGVSAIAAGFLDDLVFAYGGDEELAGGARLFLHKKDLQAIGALRNQNSERIYEIIPDPANPNTGRITDGGLIVPYTIASDLDDLSTADTNDLTMLYGNPRNYKLGLFGPYTIRIDESVKALERMNAILGDMFLGGNVIVPDGFIIAKKAASGGGGTEGTEGTE